MTLRTLHVVSSLRLSAGGPTQSVTQLCEALNALGVTAEIATVRHQDDIPWTGRTSIHWFEKGYVAKLHRSRPLCQFLQQAVRTRFDIVHVHGLWEWPGLYARMAALSARKPLVLSPRGMIGSWSLRQGRIRKGLARLLWEERTWRSASLFHATSAQEAECIRAQGLTQPITIIPNGLTAPDPPPSQIRGDFKRLLFLSRLHPGKGLEELLIAWLGLQDLHPEWELVIAGPDEGAYGTRMRELSTRLNLRRVTFLGPVHGSQKWSLIQSADLFVLPSHSENFGNVIPEALSQAVPVITTHGTPWELLERESFGWWIPLQDLRSTLDEAFSRPLEDLREMGLRGRHWVKRHLDWSTQAKAMIDSYHQLLGSNHVEMLRQGGEP